MNVSYIYHSGFLVETQDACFLFDWFDGALPHLSQEKPLFVFASHSHGDHFSRKIFDLPARRFILSDDIPQGEIPGVKAVSGKVIRMGAHERVQVPLADRTEDAPETTHFGQGEAFLVRTLASNDLGVAFVLTTREGNIYHAGDLNNWWWDGDAEDRKLEKAYHEELERIRGMHFEAAMIPYDLRLREPGFGIRDFLQYCTADRIYGMHLNASREEGQRRLERDSLLKDFVIL